MKNFFTKLNILIGLVFAPLVSFAQPFRPEYGGLGGSGGSESYAGLISNVLKIIENLTVLGSGVALFLFLWGVVKYFTNSDSAAKRSESVQTITYGLIALFVLVAVWGLVKLLQESLLPGSSGGLNIPQF
jgi:flagellar biogenesis protein FliO